MVLVCVLLGTAQIPLALVRSVAMLRMGTYAKPDTIRRYEKPPSLTVLMNVVFANLANRMGTLEVGWVWKGRLNNGCKLTLNFLVRKEEVDIMNKDKIQKRLDDIYLLLLADAYSHRKDHWRALADLQKKIAELSKKKEQPF